MGDGLLVIGYWLLRGPEWYSGEWKKRGFEGLWAIEGLFSAALQPSTQPVTANMEGAGIGLDEGA